MTPSALRFDGVSYRYDDRAMRFDLELPAGGWWALIGPSGAGKSTLLDLAAGFLEPEAGRIFMGGEDVTNTHPATRPLSFVFQENNLFPHLDAFRNVALGISPNLRLSATEKARVEAALQSVGLAGLGKRKPAEMSGGERQRVALARAFLRDRPLLLLDEPFAALGPALRRDMLKLIADLRKAVGAARMTVLMVTHQPDDARGFADTVAFVEAGRIAAIGPADAILASDGDTGVGAYLGRADLDKV